jgi:flavin reductase (DIM6/NTAB) family NADH-FMN oxidoreductase RutF
VSDGGIGCKATDFTAGAGTKVNAPLIKECDANFEFRLYDGSQISKHSLFIWEVVKSHVPVAPKIPETAHYRGDGVFMISGRNISRRRPLQGTESLKL